MPRRARNSGQIRVGWSVVFSGLSLSASSRSPFLALQAVCASRMQAEKGCLSLVFACSFQNQPKNRGRTKKQVTDLTVCCLEGLKKGLKSEVG